MKRTRATLTAFALALCVVPAMACATLQGNGVRALEVVSCVAADERLSVVFKRPDLARAYVKRLADRADAGDPEAVRELVGLMFDLAGCI